MRRTWDTTGLYKASKDRMPAKRSRRIRSTPPAAVLVPRAVSMECSRCGFALDTNGHRMLCMSDMNNSEQT